ncbi:unnamed protein product [Rotaria magnacalcarata]|uniref:Dynein beta chain, ciliary n=15 Tax=Rotaria magnacalcarata TaxID=392030 RepID=A0A816WZ27_9BILA|nr:unnamed protein product [Rotaria magnacalcarata]
MAEDLELNDPRIYFVADYVLKTLKLKSDKFAKMYGLEENKIILHEFFDKADSPILVVQYTAAGSLQPTVVFPNVLKNKSCYFIKKRRENIPRDSILRDVMMYGDLSTSPVDQLSAMVDELLIPILQNPSNNEAWPKVLSQDILRHALGIKNKVHILNGQMKGKTLLPVPAGAERATDDSTNGQQDSGHVATVDSNLLHAIESVVIEWSHQVQDVLKKDSSQALLDGGSPRPGIEVEFWKSRYTNLLNIHEQLNDARVKKMAELLRKTNSSYYPAFESLLNDVSEALEEAKEIDIFLKPVSQHFDGLETTDFGETEPIFGPMFHTVCLMWANCKAYRRPARIIVLLQELNNLVMKQASEFMEPIDLFKGEPDESMEKINTTVRSLEAYQSAYITYKNNLKSYFKDGEPVKEFDFAPKLVFAKWDKFMERVRIIQDLFQTAAEFLRLEKVEIGGVKGKTLSSLVLNIFELFKEEFEKMSNKKYDPLDPACIEFLEDIAHFKHFLKDMELKLAAIINQAFDDSNSLTSQFKLISILGSMLERPAIREAFVRNYYRITLLVEQEIDACHDIYEKQMAFKKEHGTIELHRNKPPIAGSIEWVDEMKDRINEPLDAFTKLDYAAKETDDGKRVLAKHEELIQLLDKFAKSIFDDWSKNVGQAANFNLKQNLLTRNTDSQIITTNFDPQLIGVLREVKYMQQTKTGSSDQVPEEATKMYQENEKFVNYVTNLDYTTKSYNKIRLTILDVEKPLVEKQLEEIDKKLLRAEKELSWSTAEIWDYIKSTRAEVHDLENRLHNAKANVEQIQRLMSTWQDVPLYKRSEGKSTLLYLDDKEQRLNNRYKELDETGKKITGLLKENGELLKVENYDSDAWKNYVDYVDQMVLEGFRKIINCNLMFFLRETDSAQNPDPLFESQLQLQAPNMSFNPSMDENDKNTFSELIEDLLNTIYKQGSLFARLAVHTNQANYQDALERMQDLGDLRTDFIDRVHAVIVKANEYRALFNKYAYLWVDDRTEFMRQFLLYGHVLTQEEIEANADQGVTQNPPTLQQFKEQVDAYESIYDEVSKFEDTKILDRWFRVDSRPFKQALLNIAKKWSFMFKQHLMDDVTNSLQDLAAFIKLHDKGLTVTVHDGDYDSLVGVMGHLGAIREKQPIFDVMFEPLKQKLELLKSYGQEIHDDVYERLNALPEKWANTKKLSMNVKQQVAPLQTNEVANLRRKVANFDVRQYEFREKFRKELPFAYDQAQVYKKLDQGHIDISNMEREMQMLNDSAALFEVTVPDFKQVKQCRKEIKLLKQLWDYVLLVRTTFDDWKKTKWREINAESMDQECKKFAKDIRALDKEMRAWNAYSGLDDAVKNMMTSLRAVTELQNPAIRERHWLELMKATGVKFEMTDSTTFSDLLALRLHQYEDEVKNIVDKAVKEMAMEKVLRELDNTWKTMEFTLEPHTRTKLPLVVVQEELIEVLEENQVQLQNMLTSKYIAHFLKEVTDWQRSLSQADQVIHILIEVQKTWSHLESIFIGSQDIRNQLPEDSARFDQIDKDFHDIAAENQKDLNVVRCTNRAKLNDGLENIKARLSLCEKALADYLETKRLAFPRFYFVSAADLLDILSNGNEPEKVMRHLTKLFDSMAKLKLTEERGAVIKEATAMWAKDGEYMTFPSPCDLSGQVEIWLNRLLEKQCETVRYHLTEAVGAYEEKPRDQWIMDFQAQIALTGSQVWWTVEVCAAFAKLEEGYENALKDFYRKQVSQLNALIIHLLTELTPNDRQKIMTICTIDVHARDVVLKLVGTKCESVNDFMWQCQLRHRWDDKEKDCFANICDAQFRYAHEYLGNQARLVITPLTDRCYITLTQSLHLVMGGAPAGPAGTGKTETTKDLGRALGIMVYVFNCSEQMDYKSCGNIYKGLSQTGAWGCFDEFNRISVEVLSVIAVQVKSIQDAIREKKTRFIFMGEEIRLNRTVGLFITMNPGYAGRTELPENLKALFRPCAMVVPDFDLISEIMMVAEGFTDARLLARKFITLYSLCKELLSKQDHYDWGLRAIKSVLVVAGALRRSDPGRPEDQVLMRALRDFNIPKIVTDDMPVFMGLIGDLFPALDVPRKRNLDFEKLIKQATVDLKLQPEDSFILKVVQLQELFEVRHSVFIVGNAGTGKSQIWKVLNRTYFNQKRKPMAVDLNPKAVTNDELFGIINPATREWKDGLFSTIMRDLANLTSDGPKWIVLDGDIDPMWIESLNTVMDDNKVLTLASNERIPLNPTMRLLFEISHLRTATPATVSRAGILYINPADLGWNPQVATWIETREIQSERANLTILFDKYVPMCLDAVKSRFKKITPIVEGAHIHMLCRLLECMLTATNTPPDCPKELYELYFAFACVWAFGSALFQDQITDHRLEFSKWWITEFKTIKFPVQGTVFDYYIDSDTKKFEPWTKLVPKFRLDNEIPLQSVLVPTSETTRIRYFMDLLLEKGWPIMLVGNAGCGKTVLINDKLGSLNEDWLAVSVPFNFYTTSDMLQSILEKPLEKKAGRNYGPPGSKKIIYFIDDMNMPEVDQYYTCQPHTLLRQHLDYKHWYDRQKLTLKEIHNCQYVSAMNPTAGSFTIDTRLQRHFAVFAVSFPGIEALETIYVGILSQHLAEGFPQTVQKYTSSLVRGALELHRRITVSFLPTAIKFHYIFNLRDLSNIFQAILFAKPDAIKTHHDLIRLYLHESERVYCDKLVDRTDIDMFTKLQREVAKKSFDEIDEDNAFKKPNLYCHFALGVGDPKYMPIDNWTHLQKLLNDALDAYNELNAQMNLVLFEDAMTHICRINRILEAPRGNALLIGVGGSGKQSLARLAASISSLEVFQITLRKGYNINDLKTDLGALYIKAGQKGIGTVFLMTDSQVADEKFLVLINDMLASGEIPGLFADDAIDEIIGSMRNEVKAQGIDDTRENIWKYFIEKVRRNLKVVLCFSPVGTTLRVRSRKFPAITNCTSIDWYHEWPEEALISVANRFVSDVDTLKPELKDSVAKFMAFVHKSVNEMSITYLQNDKRYNYTTPKSFLEQITLYKNLLSKKTRELQEKINRLESGLVKLQSCARQVDDLKDKLAAQEVELKQKNEDADKLIKIVGTETEKVSKEKEIAGVEQAKVAEIEKSVTIKADDCERDLARAMPALKAAEEALNTLDKNSLTEMKAFPNPPEAVLKVGAAVMCLLPPGGKIPRPAQRDWKACKASMGNVDQFLQSLKTYDKEHIRDDMRREVKVYIDDPDFDPDKIRTKSAAAAGLSAWVINIVSFYEVYCEVEPKRLALEKANAELKAARDKLDIVNRQLAQLEEALAKLTAEYDSAMSAKQKCQEEADRTAYTINLANRLVNGLASENVRWRDSVAGFRKSEETTPGDVLLITAFVSYVGCFTKMYRVDLMENFWRPQLSALKTPIPVTPEIDPLILVIDDAVIAGWNNEGLPSDRMSTENATILTTCERWPLMVDPQLQGIKWIKQRYGERIKVIRLGQKGYLDKIEQAIAAGDILLIENIDESIEAVLDPLLGRNTIKKGRAIKLGDKEIEYHPDFRLILQTKLANPHYKPEMQAQTTLINFTVTKDGLEDQLLADVVAKERPDLERLKSDLTKQQNEFKITLKRLEDNLLARLSSAGANFLGDTELVENLESTKRTATEIEEKVGEAKITSVKIDEARELYRPAAARASLVYFIMNDLCRIHPMYQFSLKAFKVVFASAIEKAEPSDDVKIRVHNLIDSITYSTFLYTTRGLFEKHKLIFTSQMSFLILLAAKEIDPKELDFLLRFPVVINVTTPVDFLNDISWGGIKALSQMNEFTNLDRDIEGSAKRWKKFVEMEAPEKEKLPQEWKNKTPLQKLCMMRALRPDRMLYALSLFVEEKLGKQFVENRAVPFNKSYEETNASTPVFFILSPGVDPIKDVEALGKKLGFTQNQQTFHNISLGQGQQIVAEEAMDVASKEGHWVVLQNIHLVAKWLPQLEKKLEQCAESGHESFRIFLSAEPSADPAFHCIPQGILESAVKITNEPPTGMQANLHKALDLFNQDTLEMCAKETEFKSILFALCYFHAVVAERRKFGAQGWNRNYPFNNGDLTISVNVLYNYLEANSKVPWEDLRYLFGEIMYGGHITDDWDRRLCKTYLEEYMNPTMFDGELYLAPNFPIPPSTDYKGYHGYIDEFLPPESPYLYGLHPNAEIDFLTTTSENLFKTVLEMQPRDAGAGAGGEGAGMTREEKIKAKLDEILEKLPDEFPVRELYAKAEEKTPYTVVALQECERMNYLTSEIRRSLKELNLGLKGELTITADMELLQDSLFFEQVPAAWTKRAYPSMFNLGLWYSDLLLRIKELEIWTGDFQLPAAVWLGGLFNPQSFLTAIMQTTARKNEWPLDKMCLSVDVTKKSREELGGAPREGAYVHGLYMEGARWDTQTGQLSEARLKELTPMMPVCFVKAIPVDRRETKNIYECPVYKTKQRGPTFVWTFNLRTKEKPAKWVLGGVCLLLAV